MKKQKLGLFVGAAVLALTSTLGGTAVAAPSSATATDVQPVMHTNSSTSTGSALNRSLGGVASTDSVIGPDGRVQVTNTTLSPNRMIVQIEVNGGTCSGSMISDDTVLTAGHCVHPGGTRSTADFFNVTRVTPGRNGSTSPYGSCGAVRTYTDQRWIDSANTNADWGVIKLNCTIGNTVGWFNYRGTTGSLDGTNVTVRGYPGDKPRGTMWTMSGPVLSSATEKIRYTIDTAGGQSGSPVYDNSTTIVAIHTNGGFSSNAGTRITPGLASYLTSVR